MKDAEQLKSKEDKGDTSSEDFSYYGTQAETEEALAAMRDHGCVCRPPDIVCGWHSLTPEQRAEVNGGSITNG